MRKILLTAATILAATLAADAQSNFEKGKPNNSNYTYLNDYRPLKEYIDRTKYPNFKLGVGTTVNDYLQKGTVYKLTNSNFHETVAGNAMKMASCVNSSGTMTFTTVTNYVNTATAAGLNVYGHTLAWHSQQPNGWLRSLIKDKPAEELTDYDVIVNQDIMSKDFTSNQTIGWHSDYTQYGYNVTFDSTNGLHAKTTKSVDNYLVQYIPISDVPVEKGKTYTMTITIKGSKAGTLYTAFGDWDASGRPSANISFTTEWKDVQVKYTASTDGAFLLCQHGSFVGDIYIKKISFAKQVKAKNVTEDRRCLVIETKPRENYNYDNQFWLNLGSFPANSKFEFTADVRADIPAKASTQVHNSPGTYVDYQALGDIYFTEAWKTVTVTGTIPKAGQSIAFNLSEYEGANKYYFDNISLKINGAQRITNGSLENTSTTSFRQKVLGGGVVAPTIATQITYLYVPSTVPLTMEEKRVKLAGAMEKWIKGMMNACGGKVKAWDVVNEAISGGGNDGQGNYTLQHSDGFNGEATWDVGGDAFYWQDHMGDLDYVRTAVKYARQYGPADVKLFINDYNLESDWDGNKKLKSLINWIKKWEADGVTKIDGIGTQMHISYFENSGTMASKKNAIENMFKLMAETGKLVRVSELDMGYQNSSNQTLGTSSLTEQQHKNMADFYKWIIQKYLEIIPPAQQWGICQWCATDAPGALGTGWRGGEPVGIWDGSYYRKHVYAGFAEGLGGVPTSAEKPAVADKEYDGPVYNLQGVRMKANSLRDLPSGIYIINGKKVKK